MYLKTFYFKTILVLHDIFLYNNLNNIKDFCIYSIYKNLEPNNNQP